MKPTTKPTRTPEELAEEEAIRKQHKKNPIQKPSTGAINRQSFEAILNLVAKFKSDRESQGLTLGEVADRMGIDQPALSRLENGKMLNPTLATLLKWAEPLGMKLSVELNNGRNVMFSTKLKMGGWTQNVDVIDFKEWNPFENELRVFCGKVVKPKGKALDLRKDLPCMLVIDEKEQTVHFFKENDEVYFFIGHEIK